MLEAALLVLVAEEPRYGYELWQELRTGALVAGRMHVGRVYETLGRLAAGGFLRTNSPEVPGDRRQYEITPSGRGRLRRWLSALELSAERIDALLERAAQRTQSKRATKGSGIASNRTGSRPLTRSLSPRRSGGTLPKPPSRRKRTMTYVITEPCIGTKDRSCVDVCPVDCIHDDGDSDRMLYINPEECIDCGACEPACPVTAIFVDYDVPEQWQGYADVNSLWYKDPAAARVRVEELLASTQD